MYTVPLKQEGKKKTVLENVHTLLNKWRGNNYRNFNLFFKANVFVKILEA